MRIPSFLLLVLLVPLSGALLAGCSDSPSECSDGIDNDGDGLFDEDDPGCSWQTGDLEFPDPTECNDGIDNDNDGLIDGVDWGCQTGDNTTEQDPLTACNNGVDDDSDLLADYPNDPGCDSPIDDTELNDPACSDGVDNDGDELVDFPDDPGCEDPGDRTEEDPAELPACADGIDNDGDGDTDYPDDSGCSAASDDLELDPCLPGVELTVHPGGSVSGSTASGSTVLEAPLSCEDGGDTAIARESVYVYTVERSLENIVFDTEGSSMDTVLYIRPETCNSDGGLALCSDNLSGGAASQVEIPSPVEGPYYIVVDGKTTIGGIFELTVSGTVSVGGACDAADSSFPCVDGSSCVNNVCTLPACNDGIDNDGDSLVDADDPGCESPSDTDEADPAVLPACGDGVDNDGDGATDYPADPGCTRASDDDEDNCGVVDDFESGSFPGTAWVGRELGGTVSSPGHTGANSLLDPGWHYRDDVSFGGVGDTIEAWVRTPATFAVGRAYLGFSSTASGTLSFVLSPGNQQILLQSNTNYNDFTTLSAAGHIFSPNTWYRLEVEFLAGDEVIGRLYAGDGSLLVTTQHAFGAPLPVGGVGVRGFGGYRFDDIVGCVN